MQAALKVAREAAESGEVPVGAVVIRQSELLAGGFNQTIAKSDPTAHAEIVSIRLACEIIGNYRLTGCSLYVTMEPCPMCFSACMQARLDRLIFGTPDPRWGAAGSRLDLTAPGLFNHTLQITGGVLTGECRELLQDFFTARR